MSDGPKIPDAEILQRRLQPDRKHCVFADGKWRASTQAFGDRGGKPSVDQASLCPTGLAWTQDGDPRNGVAVVLTGSVRLIKITAEAEGKRRVEHAVDVHSRPIKDVPNLPDNEAHAQIEPQPEWATGNAFRKLLERLSRLAEVKIRPACVRDRDA